MPKRSNPFQKLVALINGCMGAAGRLEESALLIDKVSGEEREVDILILSKVGDYPVNISIEVIDRARKADVSWVEAMHAKHAHLPTNKLILVSRQGFTKPALEKAQFYGIEAFSFDEALDTDWDLAIRLSSSGFFSITKLHYKCSAVCAHPEGQRTFSSVKRSTHVYLPYRDMPTDFDKMAEFFLFEPRIEKLLHEQIMKGTERSFILNYTPQPGTYVLDGDGTRMPLVKVSFGIEVEHTTTPVNFAIGRYGKREIVTGTSSNTEGDLHFVLIRKEDGPDEGLLMDGKGVRKLARSEGR